MTWPFGPSAAELIEAATGMRVGGVKRTVTRSQAMRHSAVWACQRLRADLISTMPADVFRRVGSIQVEQVKPPVMSAPGGADLNWVEFMDATQRDVDGVGNTFGLITAFDGTGVVPARIELQPAEVCSVLATGQRIDKYRIDGKLYDPRLVWHERQYMASGSPVGLSPIANAAMSINGYLTAQEFAAKWFSNSATPAAHLKESSKELTPGQSRWARDRFRESVDDGGLFVSGMNWEYKMLGASASESQFLESQQFSIPDVCRFLGVPGDMIDAESSSGSITYANITQRNLQLLIMNLGPAIVRRETAITNKMLSGDRYVKLNPAALLRMDLKSRYEGYKLAIDGRWMPPSRVLDLENQPPLTPEEKAEFAELFPVKAPVPTGGATS